MFVKVINECGFEEALYGLSLSYRDRGIPTEEWWTHERYTKMKGLAAKQACRDGGHNKYLESIAVWIDIEAPRYWWQDFDTYRVGMTKQSESSTRGILKIDRELVPEDFEDQDISIATLKELNLFRDDAAQNRGKETILRFKNRLPEAFLQRRVVCTNYKTLRNIIRQRAKHLLPQFQEFVRTVLEEVEHPELLPNLNGEDR